MSVFRFGLRGDDAREHLVEAHLGAGLDQQFDDPGDRGGEECSIFIASTITTGSPAATAAPEATGTAITEPGMGLWISASPTCSSPTRTLTSATSRSAAMPDGPATHSRPSCSATRKVRRRPSLVRVSTPA